MEVTKAQVSWREWRKRFIVVSGNGWENFEEDVLDGSVPYPICQWQGKPSKDSRKCLELGVVHLSRVGAAIAWAKKENMHANHWNNPEWILQAWQLERSLAYRGLDRSMTEEKMARMELALLVPEDSFFPGTKVGPPHGSRERSSVANAVNAGCEQVQTSQKICGSRNKRKAEGTLTRPYRKTIVPLTIKGGFWKSDRLKGICTPTVVNGSAQLVVVKAWEEDPVSLSNSSSGEQIAVGAGWNDEESGPAGESSSSSKVGKTEAGKESSVGMQVPQAAWKKVEASSSEWDMMGTDIRKLSFLEVE